MAAGEPTRQDPSAPKVLAAQTRGDSRPKFAGGQIKGLSAAWTRSWQLLDSTLWSLLAGDGVLRRARNRARVLACVRVGGMALLSRSSSHLHTYTNGVLLLYRYSMREAVDLF